MARCFNEAATELKGEAMRRYRRNYEGRTFFFTLVTHHRRAILTTDLGRQALREAIQSVRREHPFEICAIVLLPDHLHALWELTTEGNDYSKRWRVIKSKFTKTWLKQGGENGTITSSRMHSHEQGIWQRRFYEHTCRDEADFTRCIESIHANSVKHQLVNRVIDWPWSSFHRDVAEGFYPPEWGGSTDWYGDEFKDAE